MDAVKRRWPSLLAGTLGLLMLLVGYQSYRAVKKERRDSIERMAAVTDLNPLGQRNTRKSTWVWIGIRYRDENGDLQSALAYARSYSIAVVGDSVIALFGEGKKSAVIKSWRDWIHSVCFVIIGAWMLAIAILIRNLLLDSPKGGNRVRKRSGAGLGEMSPQALK